VQNHSNQNVFHLHVDFPANQAHFHTKGFARGKGTELRKWPIDADGGKQSSSFGP